MAIILVPFLVFVVGVLVYVLSSNAKVQEVGRAMLWCGLLVTLFSVAKDWAKLG
jgi:hypothetical protein